MVDKEPHGRTDTDARRGNSVPAAEVGAMFDRIAGTYDPINALISGFQEPRWRARLVASCRLEVGMAALDVATGTGTVARDLARRVGPTGVVVGVDISVGMLEVARS
ncbi:MAG: class I SAM-dependent methyltransferase, partial [Chloroflexota bacterium]